MPRDGTSVAADLAAIAAAVRAGRRGPDPVDAPTLEAYERREPDPAHIGGLPPRAGGGAPLVSIVTPVFDGARLLRRALDSVSAQTYGVVEHVVVDGGSRDGTLDILRERQRVGFRWLSEPDEGLYDAINKGIAMSRGEIVKILNADDTLPPDSVARAVAALEARGEPACVRGRLGLIDDADRLLAVRSGDDRPGYLPPGFPVLHPTWYMPRVLYQQHGLYSLRYRVSSDWEYFLRLLHRNVPFVDLDDMLVCFRTGGLSSGFRGLREGFEINTRYMGPRRATWIFSHMFAKKGGSWVLRRAGGERAIARFRRTPTAIQRRGEGIA